MEIHYLTYQLIDKTKWDACIDSAPNGLVYAYSYYLDSMAKNWDALVLSAGPATSAGYETVMPLTWNKKYGIHYLYQPAFTACLGIFGRNISVETVNRFLLAIPPRFKYWDIYFNPANLFKPVDFELYERMNYVLNLNSAETGFYFEQEIIFRMIFYDLVDIEFSFGPWPHQAHFAFNDIPQLRQFVKPPFTHHFTPAGNTGVMVAAQFRPVLFCIRYNAPELEHGKRAPFIPDPFLYIKQWPPG